MKYEILISTPIEARELSKEIQKLYENGLGYHAALREATEKYKKKSEPTLQSKSPDKTINKIITVNGGVSNGST